MIELTQHEKTVVSGCWCDDGNKCLPWNKVNGYTEIDFGGLWCLGKIEGTLFCAKTVCCSMKMLGKHYDGYTYQGDVFNSTSKTIGSRYTESGYCEFFECQ